MIKKFKSIAAGMLMSVLVLGVLSGCKGNSSIEQLLETVPQDALFVVAIDGQKTIDALEIKEEGGKFTYCKELGDVFTYANANPDQINRALGLIMNTGRAGVIFADGNNVWFTFRVNEESKFMDFYKSVEGHEPEKEDGIYVLDRTSALFNNQVWICTSGHCDMQDIRRFANMKKEESFMKNNKFASQMVSGGCDVSAILNIQKTMQLARRFGGNDVAMAQTALGLLFDDAAYLTYTAKVNYDGMEAEVDLLNSDFKPSKFNLPLENIDMSALDELKGNASVVAAVGVPSELVNKLIGLASAALGSAETELLSSISGTAAMALNVADESGSFVISLKDASLASMLQQNIGYLPNMETSVKGKRVVGATPGISGRSGALEKVGELKGKLAGAVVDLSNVPARVTEGFDLSKIGLVTLFLEKNGDGLRLKAKADVKDPVKTILNMVNQSMQASNSYSSHEEELFLEPDSDEDYEIVEADTAVVYGDDYSY